MRTTTKLKSLNEQRATKVGEYTEIVKRYEGKDTITKEDEDLKRQLLDDIDSLDEKIETQKREDQLLEDEARRQNLDNTTAARVAADLAGTGIEDTEGKELDKIARSYSFGKAAAGAYGESLEGVEKEMHERGKRQMLEIGKASTGIVIPHDMLHRAYQTEQRAVITENGTTGIQSQSFIDAVYANTILGPLGPTRLTTTTDQRLPVVGTVTTQWEGEVDDAADGGSALSTKDLTPKRLAAYVDYSKQSAMQHNDSLEAALRRNIAMAVAAKLEYAVFTSDSGGPTWIGNGKTAVTSGTLTGMILGLIQEVIGNNHNKGNLGFAIGHELFSEVYQAVLATGVSALVQNNQIMGLPFGISSQIADIALNQETIYYGDWSSLNMAQFGGMEVLYDPYTQATKGTDRLHLNSYWDHVLAQDNAISVAGYTG